jgi:hypothetical protein
MKEAQLSEPLQLEGSAALAEKKLATQLEVIEKLSKPTQMEVSESSKQVAVQLNHKEGGGKVP